MSLPNSYVGTLKNKIYAHLKQKKVEVAIWGDHLIEGLRGKRIMHVPNPKGTPYDMPGGLSAEQVKALIPKDILVFNWFWTDGREGQGERNDRALSRWGFRQVYGNMRPDIANFDRRGALPGVLGGAPSSWAATSELNFGKDLMYEFLGCANLLWSTARPGQAALLETAQRLLPRIRRNLSALPFPSDHDAVAPVAMAGSGAIPVGQDVSSLIFLHTAAKPARNKAAYTGTWNFADTADLLGWYEVVYEDGLIEPVPIRYGVNILEAGWLKERKPDNLAYQAELIERDGQALFSYEWINPRFGKVVKEVRLHSGAVRLAGIGMVKQRVAPEPKPGLQP